MFRTTAVLLLGLITGATAQSVPHLRKDGSGTWQLWIAPESGAPAALVGSGLEVLPLDLAGFAARDRLRPDVARPADGAPAPHVALAEGGSLYLVRAGVLTALLHVRADGSVAAPLVLQGPAGPALAGTVAKAPDGANVLVATPGGEAWLASLAGAAPRQVLPPGAGSVDPSSLRVSAARAFCVAGGVLHVADLSGTAPAAPVPLGAPGDVVLPDLAVSGDGRSVAAVTQDAGGLRLVHVVDPALNAWQITAVPGLYDTPTAEDPFGPWLALSADGSHVACRASIGASTEIFLRAVPQVTPALQVTGDANFIDTIDNVGVLGFVGASKLHFFAGEKPVGTQVAFDSADLYAVQPQGAGVAFANVTLTSGDAQAPFTQAGDLEVIDQALDPTAQELLLVVDPAGADAAIYSVPVDGSAAASPVLPALAGPPQLHPAGDAVLVVSQGCAACPSALQLVRAAGAPLELGTLPGGLQVDRVTAGGGSVAFVVSAAPGLELAVRVNVASGVVDLPWPFVGTISDAIGLSPLTGALRLGIGSPAGPPLLFLQLDATLAGKVLDVPVGDGLPLDT